jgi:hypothetical protein
MLERNFGRVEEDVVYIVSPGGMRFEFNEPEEPDEVQQAQCYQMLADAEEAIFSEDHTVYEKYIDVDSFVNFYIFHEMVKDVDFGQYSTRYYFKDGVMYAGPVWDLDLSMGNVSGEKNEEKYDLYNNLVEEEVFDPDYGDSSSGLWVSAADYYYWLCRDPWFMSRVQQRWQAVRPVTENLTTANELGESVIDMYMEAHGEALESNFMEGAEEPCWMVNVPSHVSEWHQPADTYEGNVEILRQWLVKRAAYLDTQFGQYIYEPEKAVN